MANTTKRSGSGNFAEDPQRASETAKTGAERTRDGSQS
jgi:general stress protein YciG